LISHTYVVLNTVFLDYYLYILKATFSCPCGLQATIYYSVTKKIMHLQKEGKNHTKGEFKKFKVAD